MVTIACLATFLVACRNDSKSPGSTRSAVLGLDGGGPGSGGLQDGGSDDADSLPDAAPPPRLEEFACDTSAGGADIPDPQLFEGAVDDWLVVRSDGHCVHTLLHRDGAGVEVPIFTSDFYFPYVGVRDPMDGTLVACTSTVHLSAPNGQIDDIRLHTIENVTVDCAARPSGGSWTSPVTLVTPPGNEWAAWMDSISTTGQSGQYVLRWIHDRTLSPFTPTNKGRPGDDGIYEAAMTLSGGSLTAGVGSKVSNDIVTGEFEAPGTLVPWDQSFQYGGACLNPCYMGLGISTNGQCDFTGLPATCDDGNPGTSDFCTGDENGQLCFNFAIPGFPDAGSTDTPIDAGPPSP
jgi:hypothetical protein